MTDTPTPELLACPFCSGEAEAAFSHESGRSDIYEVSCPQCEITKWTPQHGLEGNAAKQAAIAAWNTRLSNTTPTVEGVEELRKILSPTAIKVLTSDRFKAEGWEPPQPNSAVIAELVDQGLFKRCDARCGFEAIKDAWIKPTAAGLLARAALASPPTEAPTKVEPDDRVCQICDGGPGNDCACLCGFQKYSRVSEAMIDKALKAVVPGGSTVMAWLPMADGWTAAKTARDVVRAILSSALDTLTPTVSDAQDGGAA